MENKVEEMESRYVLLILLISALSAGACQRKAPTEEQQKEDYRLVWADEFERDGRPDPANWTYERGFSRNEELQWYQEDNAYVDNGFLVIEGRREVVPNPDFDPDSDNWRRNRREAAYTSACLITKGLHAWQYGRFEIRAKIRTEAGLWPAIWMLGLDHEWPSGGEIDIMEYYSGNILANAAWAGANRYEAIWDDLRQPVSSFNDPDWDDRFHLWRMDWTEESIKIFLDEELLNTIPLDKTINKRGKVINPFRETQHYLLLNLAIGGKNGGDPSGTDFPSRFEIDYVRAYQRKADSSNR